MCARDAQLTRDAEPVAEAAVKATASTTSFENALNFTPILLFSWRTTMPECFLQSISARAARRTVTLIASKSMSFVLHSDAATRDTTTSRF
jgi:hypothetical protein